MKAFQYFINEITKLEAFYRATLYAYDQTEELLIYKKNNKIKFDVKTETGLLIKQPHSFNSKRSGKIELRKNLCEIVFVRVVSALEVFLVDLVRDAFLESKEPFKKQDIIPQFSQAELLSFQSTSEIYAKIINKETRKLTSGGFLDILKFYKKYFDIEIASFAPGKSKMEEYHDRRHLLVHRLGKTDAQYRDKYNTTKQGISIDEDYLIECIKDFKYFSDLVNNQVIYQLKNELSQKPRKSKQIERAVSLHIELLKSEQLECIKPDFEFWASDEFSSFNDIQDSRNDISDKIIEIIISGSFRQIKSYLRILKKIERQKEIKLFEKDIHIEEPKEKNSSIEKVYAQKILDEEILLKIQEKLPIQPWQKGIHKIVAEELNIPNKLVTIAIKQLIVKGIFNPQIDGKVILSEEDNKDADSEE